MFTKDSWVDQQFVRILLDLRAGFNRQCQRKRDRTESISEYATIIPKTDLTVGFDQFFRLMILHQVCKSARVKSIKINL